MEEKRKDTRLWTLGGAQLLDPITALQTRTSDGGALALRTGRIQRMVVISDVNCGLTARRHQPCGLHYTVYCESDSLRLVVDSELR